MEKRQQGLRAVYRRRDGRCESRDPLPRQGGTTYHFATGGPEAALANARAAAEDADVGIRALGTVWPATHPLAVRLRRRAERGLHAMMVEGGWSLRDPCPRCL
jgi:hypothetical protein